MNETVEQSATLNESSDCAHRDPPAMAICRRVPWSFRVAKYLIRRQSRGGYRLLEMTRKRGWLDRVVRYSLSDKIAIDVPLFREDNCFDATEVRTYELALMQMLERIVPSLRSPVTVIDGGADIGLFTMRLVAQHPNIAAAFAFEPNEDAYQWLVRNLSMLPIACHPACTALGESGGRGELRSPDYDASDHGKYISPCDEGAVSIVRIDDLNAINSTDSLLLKLDVEGAELAALRGARTTIKRAHQVVVAMEAHTRVAARTGIDPAECLRLLTSIRPFQFRVAECPDVLLSPNRSVFEQIAQRHNYNIVAVSRKARP